MPLMPVAQVLNATPGVTVLNRATTLVAVGAGVSTEGTLYSYSLPGGTMAVDSALRLTVLGRWNSQSAGANTITFRIKFGGTTIYQGDSPSYSGAGQPIGAFVLDMMLANMGATNAQNMAGVIGLSRSSATTGLGALLSPAAASVAIATSADAAIDTTSTQTLALTAQHSLGNGNNTIWLRSAILELI